MVDQRGSGGSRKCREGERKGGRIDGLPIPQSERTDGIRLLEDLGSGGQMVGCLDSETGAGSAECRL